MRIAIALCLLTSTAHADPKLPAHYARLFQKDHVITYDVVGTFYDSEKMSKLEEKGRFDRSKVPESRWPRTVDKQVMKCKVARVEKLGASIVSEVTCDLELIPTLGMIAGVYLANATGLYRLGDFPAKEADLPKDMTLAIAAAPKASRIDAKETDGKGFRGVRAEAGAWCTFYELTGAYHGHNGKSNVCYGRGVVASVLDDFGPELRQWKVRAR